MKKLVFRNSENYVINIGEWDYMLSIDEKGHEIISNPLPEGATSKEEEVEILPDGGLSVKNY